jgi:hypothetical protein
MKQVLTGFVPLNKNLKGVPGAPSFFWKKKQQSDESSSESSRFIHSKSRQTHSTVAHEGEPTVASIQMMIDSSA